MARPGLDKNPKFRNLLRLLGEPRPHVRGYLDCLWEAAYESGDPVIGTPEMVEATAEYPGEGGRLFKALCECGGNGHPGFIEESEDGRWQIHDLYDHAPDYVKRRMERELERMRKGKSLSEIRAEAGRKGGSKRKQTTDACLANGKQTEANVKQTEANGATPAPAPAPAPAPSAIGEVSPTTPLRTRKPKAAAVTTSPEFETFWQAYPPGRRTDKPGAFEKWNLAVEAIVARDGMCESAARGFLRQRAADYAASDQGRGGYVRLPTTWLNQQGYDDPPEAWKDKDNGKQQQQLAIRGVRHGDAPVADSL